MSCPNEELYSSVLSNIQKRVSTKEHIARVTEEIIAELPLRMVNTKTVIQAANVSKTTFYRHFQDIRDVILWIYQTDMEKLCKNHTHWDQVVRTVYRYLHSKRAFFLKTLSCTAQNNLSDFIFQSSYNDLVKTVAVQEGTEEIPQDVHNAILWFCSGTQYFWDKWRASGMKQDPDEISDIILQNVPVLLRPYVDKTIVIFGKEKK